VSRVRIKGRTVVCIKPTTYMNLSGRAVRYWLDQEKLPLDRLLVVLDELALPLSRLRLKMQGSDGGHNGLKSIEETLGTRDYPRLRFGIGNDYPKGRQVEYVLGRWRDSETGLVRLKIGKCAELIESFVFAGPEATMTAFNNLNLAL
jgi:PTH1 family peptidyl-tRNA hydrolase